MIWWLMKFHGASYNNQDGYQAMSSTIPGTFVGLFLANGTPVPASPPYNVSTVATGVTPPAWAASVSDLAPMTPPIQVAATISTVDYILLFAPQEVVAIENSTDAIARQFLLAIQSSTEVNLGDPRVVHGLAYMASVGLIALDRPARVLSNLPPGN